MKEPKKRAGLVGAGYILASHATSLRSLPGVEIAAVCDISRSRAEAAARQFGIPAVYTSLDEMLKEPLDVVHVLLPPQLHEDAAQKCLEAGKSVFLEKPMGLSSKRCAKLAALAAERGLALGVDHNFLFCPAYEELRAAFKRGEIGTVDRLSVNWLYPLGLIQSGPYNNWMLESPGNLLFELGPHPLAYALDLLGDPDGISCEAGDPIDLPGNQRVYRHWTVSLRRGRALGVVSISVNPGQGDRSLSLRGSSAAARVDYGRNLLSVERTRSVSLIFDGRSHGLEAAASLRRQARRNFRDYLGSSLRKGPDTNAYMQSIHRSIEAFYRTMDGELDPRLSGAFGAKVIAACESALAVSGAVPAKAAKAARPTAAAKGSAAKAADALVIGGTGFIGKRLVALLSEGGKKRVAVLTRSAKAARLELGDLPVDFIEGSHGDAELMDRVLPGIKTVYHLARAVGNRWADYLEGDVKPTEALAKACVRNGVKRLVYTGTIDSYYSADPRDVVTGDTPLDPKIRVRNHYARSKAACEELLRRMARDEGLPLVVLRPGIVIGSGSPPAHWGVGKFESDAEVTYWGRGDNPLPFVLVDDVARALALAGKKPGIEGRTFLLTGKPLLTAREYVGLVQEYSGSAIRQSSLPIWRYFLSDLCKEAVKNAIGHPNRKRPSYRDWACRAHRCRYDSSATEAGLGWKPCADREGLVDRGIKAAVEHYYR